MNDEIDDALVELELLAVADAVGVVRGGPTEPPRQSARRRRGLVLQWRITQGRNLARRANDPYPDVSMPTEAQLRDLANELVAEHGFDPHYLARRYGLTLRRTA